MDHQYIPSSGFICKSCGKNVSSAIYGGRHRNHCPHCLCSVHLDNTPGDRASTCKGIMKPIGVHVQPNGEWSLIHRCEACGMIKINRTACDDNELLLLTIAAEPIMSLPFPSKKVLLNLQRISMETEEPEQDNF